MYGFIHRALADLVQLHFGVDKWNDILTSSNIDLQGGTFLMHRVYSDRDTFKLISASSKVLGITYEDCLEAFGNHFVKYCKASGYDRLLRVLGRNLFEFLSNLDALHDHLATSYPGMRSPSFRCSMGDKNTITLYYHSQRKGLHPIVVGVVKYVAKEFFQTKVHLSILKNRNDGNVVFSIRPQNRKVSIAGLAGQLCGMNQLSKNPEDLKMDIESFCDTFPFHIVFDQSLNIVHLGNAISQMTQRAGQRRKSALNMRNMFAIVRPIVKFSFDVFIKCSNSVFVLSPVGVSSDQTNPVRLKGQMIHLPEQNMMLFLGSPRAASLQDLETGKIDLADLKVHDSSREIIELYQKRPVVTKLMEQLEESSNNLRRLQHNLRKEQDKNADLLNSIFPPTIVSKLCSSESVGATAYDPATILFSDIVGFTALCGDDKTDPMDIVQFLNELYSKLDVLCDINRLFKVETIGDAYMVAGGIPEYVSTHADDVVNFAAGICEVTQFVHLPIYGQSVKMRIGVHSGPCIAGMVGKRMLRYCLFGNSVNVANTLEKCCEPGRMNISLATKRYLTNQSKYHFDEHIVTSQSVGPCYYATLRPEYHEQFLNQLEELGLMDHSLGGTMLLPSSSVPMSSQAQAASSDFPSSPLNELPPLSDFAMKPTFRTSPQKLARKTSEEKGAKEVSAMEAVRKISYTHAQKPRKFSGEGRVERSFKVDEMLPENRLNSEARIRKKSLSARTSEARSEFSLLPLNRRVGTTKDSSRICSDKIGGTAHSVSASGSDVASDTCVPLAEPENHVVRMIPILNWVLKSIVEN